jgi:molybdate transport system substrate-binding protein
LSFARANKTMPVAKNCTTLILLAAMLFSSAPPGTAQKSQIRVAAAADLQTALPEVAAAFEANSGTHVELVFGSSGNFFAQIQNGAPFDLFFSADSDYPQMLAGSGLALPNTRIVYGLGRIALWMPPNSPCDPNRETWECLSDSSVKKIAIANPAHAPYGRAAVASLRAAGLYGRLKDKLVLGENISQAAQFVQSRNAQAGIIAYSLALSPAMRNGKWWEIPAGLYPAIEQSAVVLKAAKNQQAAREFLAFVTQGPGRAVLERQGFLAPPAR